MVYMTNRKPLPSNLVVDTFLTQLFLTICFALIFPDITFASASTESQKKSTSQQVLKKVVEDIRHCDKTVRYEYNAETKKLNPPELLQINRLRLKKLYPEIAVFEIDEIYEGLHATTLVIGRSNAGYRWPIHSVAFVGDFQDVRHSLESLWSIHFKDMLRPGPDVIYDGKYAQIEMLLDKKKRFLSIEEMPHDVYPYINNPNVGCNHVDN
jgi:hypothetical protein